MKMKVFVVFRDDYPEGSTFFGVFDSEQKAWEFISTQQDQQDFYVREHELQ